MRKVALMTVLLFGETIWVCPNCDVTDRTPATVANRYHECRSERIKGMLAPLVPEGISCKTEKLDRDEYVGREHVQRDGDGRPVMAVHTTRDDTEERVVFAPTAKGSGQ